ncbi:9246_t:CDS:2, partial [Racocetra persica]
ARNKVNPNHSEEARNAYDDVYNALETLYNADLTKFDDNDPLTIEVIDISSNWAHSYLKNNTIDFLKINKFYLLAKILNENVIFRTTIWNLNIIWSKDQFERIYVSQVVEPLISIALENLPIDINCELNRASKNYKSSNSSNSTVEDHPDI